MLEKTYLGLVLIFFITAFAFKTIKTYLTTKQSVKGKSRKLSTSILISTTLYILILLRLTILGPYWLFEFDFSSYLIINYLGLAFVTLGFIIGILALITMNNSWRVGIKYDQKTELIHSGIYRISRNPYFLSYDLLFLGYVLIFPSIILLILLLLLAFVFHQMIIEEEKYLQSVHGDNYLKYKKRVKRYITFNYSSK
jgi:protein-S-isoprenylcysteine O-methyltransferase Ste14